MIRKLAFPALAALLPVCTGCIPPTTTGSRFNIGYVDQIIIGTTTKSDVISSMGPPPAKFSNYGDNGETWIWSYESAGGGGPVLTYKGSKLQALRISFDGNVVTDCMLATSDADGTVCNGAPAQR
ncbi:MAG TPA: hypothetical protein VHY35_02980 [Stellaceae bacterium]|jgi:hypothetical protein|nr:hypothetical protein [Stellaceae bacterium]